jgi:hypothetical protein
METDVLVRAWRGATDDLVTGPEFTSRVIRGGRRRARHAKLLAIAGVTAVTLASVAVLTGSTGEAPGPADPRLTQPTHGDLASDQAFLSDAARAWRVGVTASYNASRGIFDDQRGAPHVYWAGTTPAGRAAVVLQRAYLHPHGDLSPSDADQFQTLVGLVAVDSRDGQLKLVTDQYQAEGLPLPGYFRFGPGDRTVLVVDHDVPLYFSAKPRTQPDGKVLRDWQPLPVVDGVAVIKVPDDAAAADARVIARENPPSANERSPDGLLYLEPASAYLEASDQIRRHESYMVRSPNTDRRLPWNGAGARPMRAGVNPAMAGDCTDTVSRALEDGGALDIGANIRAWGLWCVAAGLPDGRTALVTELQQDDQPSRLYAVFLGTGGHVLGVRTGGTIDPNAPLPVAIRLPDGQGWVVAAYRSHLRYRTAADTTWLDAGDNAALLPDQTELVEVTRPDSQPVTVSLSR